MAEAVHEKIESEPRATIEHGSRTAVFEPEVLAFCCEH